MTKTIDTWEEGCESATAMVLAAYNGVLSPQPLPSLRWWVDELAIDHGGRQLYIGLAVNALHHVVVVSCDESGRDALIRIRRLLAAKQHSYGHGNINRFGLFGIVVRVSDKLARLENLLDRDEEPKITESIADTWDDIVGYCVIALMVLDGTFDLELEADKPKVESSLPGGATTCIDDIGNTYKRRDNGVWEFIGAHILTPNNFKWEN